MKFVQFSHIPKEIISSKNSAKNTAWKPVPGPFVFAKNLTQPLLENEILKQSTYIRYVITKLLKLVLYWNDECSRKSGKVPFLYVTVFRNIIIQQNSL